MVGGNTTPDTLKVGSDERGLFISARGEIRATLCYPLREVLLGQRLEDSVPPAVYVDLSECRYLDSTFIGLLVAVDKKLHRGSGGRLHVLSPSPESRDILSQIGLMDFFLVEDGGPAAPAGMRELAPSGEKPGAEFVLKAHEALMETSEEARKKFGLLKEVLEKKLRRQDPSKDNREE
jgi:anti-anti-sigma factor